MKAIIRIVIFSLISNVCLSQTTDVQIKIEWSEPDKKEISHIEYINNVELFDTVKVQLSKKNYALIFLTSSKGAMNFKLYQNEILRQEGCYENSLDTLKQYKYMIDPDTGSRYLFVSKYFEPIETGFWYYYDKKGKLIDKFNFEILLWQP